MVTLRKIEQADNPYKLMKIDVDNTDIHFSLNKLKLPTETKSMFLTINCSESKKEMFKKTTKLS